MAECCNSESQKKPALKAGTCGSTLGTRIVLKTREPHEIADIFSRATVLADAIILSKRGQQTVRSATKKLEGEALECASAQNDTGMLEAGHKYALASEITGPLSPAQGAQHAMHSGDCFRDSGHGLLAARSYERAGRLFEKAGDWGKAAEMYGAAHAHYSTSELHAKKAEETRMAAKRMEMKRNEAHNSSIV